MQYTSKYQSPVGEILLAADDVGLTGLWFDGEKYYGLNLDKEHEEKEIPVLSSVKHWLNLYFSGKNPEFMPSIHMIGTPFQIEVWEILNTIPYGQTITYGEIARRIAEKRGWKRMSAQAV